MVGKSLLCLNHQAFSYHIKYMHGPAYLGIALANNSDTLFIIKIL